MASLDCWGVTSEFWNTISTELRETAERRIAAEQRNGKLRRNSGIAERSDRTAERRIAMTEQRYRAGQGDGMVSVAHKLQGSLNEMEDLRRSDVSMHGGTETSQEA